MYKFHPYFTNDGSVGLFSEDFNDIYHSASGALTEAYEKFIYPIDFNRLLSKDKIKVLDICYGAGYNTKSFFNFLFDKIKNRKSNANNYETIYTNKNNDKDYNNEIYTDNIFDRIYIKAIDNDKILSYLSPFLKTGEKFHKHQKLDFSYDRIKKYLNGEKSSNIPKINNLINFLIFDKITQYAPDFYQNKDIADILNSEKYSQYFTPVIRRLFQFNFYGKYNSSQNMIESLNLHNIYYKYITWRYKRAIRRYNLQDLKFELKNDDARKIILEDKNTFDLIFLDAFTPSKCPCLWSLQFFQELYNHLSSDGILLTYSSSAQIRSAMLNAGFYIGHNYNERLKRFEGTIAYKKTELIKNKLSDFELGLLKTKAGIFYRDENLNASNDEILRQREIEVNNSELESSTHYINSHKIM